MFAHVSVYKEYKRKEKEILLYLPFLAELVLRTHRGPDPSEGRDLVQRSGFDQSSYNPISLKGDMHLSEKC